MSGITVVYVLAVAVVLALVLRYCHRLSWWEGNYSKRFIDGWTLTHFGHGIVFYGIWRAALLQYDPSLSILGTVMAEAVWEMLENTRHVIEWFRRRGDEEYMGDSVANSLGDYFACALGAWMTSWFI